MKVFGFVTYYYVDVIDEFNVDVGCACGLDVGPRQHSTNPGGALPCEPGRKVQGHHLTNFGRLLAVARAVGPAWTSNLEGFFSLEFVMPTLLEESVWRLR